MLFFIFAHLIFSLISLVEIVPNIVYFVFTSSLECAMKGAYVALQATLYLGFHFA